MYTEPTVAEPELQPKPRWNRFVAAQGLKAFEGAKEEVSQRDFAKANSIPRTTLQGWESRKSNLEASPELVAFFESPVGQGFLHKLLVAIHLTVKQEAGGGIQVVSRVLERAGLSPFIGLSFGAQRDVAAAMEMNILAYEAEQRLQLAKMPHVYITLVVDETFFKRVICLVAMDPLSGFIFVEEYANGRDEVTWTAAVKASLEGLPVTVIQGVSDGAKALLKHIKEGLSAHYSPDLFHQLHDIYKGIGPTLQARLKQAEKAYDEAKATAAAQVAENEKYLTSIADRGPGRPPDFESRIQTTTAAEDDALEQLKSLAEVKERLGKTVNAISDIYHPVDLATGKIRSVDEVAQSLGKSFDVLGDIADELDVPERGQKLLAKAKRLIEPMLNTIDFFHASAIKLLGGKVPSDLIAFLVTYLIPLAYLKMAEPKAKGERRALIRSTIARLTAATQAAGSPWLTVAADVRVQLLNAAQECAELFQRSSSCVEGRNGLLSLQCHAGRRLSAARLRILRILHNYDIERPDGTTAAERLSGTKPPDLFTWLLERQPPPPRPAASRPTPCLKLVA